MIMLAIVLAGVMQVQAQDFKTNESISSQLKKDNAPGLKYAPATFKAAPAAVADKNEGQESMISQIRKGTLKGMRFAEGGGAAKTFQSTSRNTARAQAGKLSSDQKAGELKPAAVNTPVVPMQGGMTEPKQQELKQVPATPGIKQGAATAGEVKATKTANK